MNGAVVRRYLFLGLFLCLLVLMGRLYYPFLTIFLWSGILYALLAPLQTKLLCRWPGGGRTPGARRTVSALLTLAGLLLVVMPIIYLALNLAGEVLEINRSIRREIASNPNFLDLSPNSPIGGFVYRVTDGMIDLSQVKIQDELPNIFPRSANRLFQWSGIFLRSVGAFLLGLIFMGITLYFLLMDGRHILRMIVGAIPIERHITRLFIRKLQSTARDLARGYGLVMGIIATILFGVYSLFGVKGALFFGVLTALSTFVPVVGPTLVMVPLAAVKALGGNVVGAVALLAISSSVVTVVDTVVRPLLLKDRLEMHPLLILFAILGGIEVFGFNGVVMGPLILMIFFTSVQLYDEAYDRAHDQDPQACEEPGDGEEGK